MGGNYDFWFFVCRGTRDRDATDSMWRRGGAPAREKSPSAAPAKEPWRPGRLREGDDSSWRTSRQADNNEQRERDRGIVGDRVLGDRSSFEWARNDDRREERGGRGFGERDRERDRDRDRERAPPSRESGGMSSWRTRPDPPSDR